MNQPIEATLAMLSRRTLHAVGASIGSVNQVLCRWIVFLISISCIVDTSWAQQGRGNDFFESKIRPVLVKHCYECHSTESGKSKGGLRLDSRDAILRGGESGPAVVPRSAERSLLFQSITYTGDYEMPPKGKLSDQVIEDVRQWIQMGAPDPRVAESVPDIQTTIDVKAGREYWAYRPPQSGVPPATAEDSWARTPIDRFIIAKLAACGLSPAGDASASVLVRRLFYVITGLPPTPQAMARWKGKLQSTDGKLNQEAVAELIDGLLGTRYFGERWGRHWMDVARFAESTGGDSNNIYQHAWRYRDYVIDAFNADKPFDRFVMEQIAGDLLPIENDEQWAENIIATGFLAVGVKLVGEEDQQKFFADLIDEQIDATSRAFLATTVACARCHDHKFDPIPQLDYYALAGIFRATETHYGLIKAQARQAATLIDITGLGPVPGSPPLTEKQYAGLVKARDDAKQAVDDAMKKIRGGENVFRGTLRRIRSVRDETEAALQSYDTRGNPLVFAMGTQDRDFPLPTRLLLRGELDKPAQLVSRGFLQVLSRPGRHALSSGLKGSGRLQLAQWIASAENPLTGRVIVNRIWHWMFGRGLVRTVDDFGSTGEGPTHPELLDYLAVQFVENGWSIKSLIRQIALSRTWQLSSTFDAEKFAVDPDNRNLWRMNKRRLEGEAVRDAMLAVSGKLDTNRPLGTALHRVGEGSVGQNVFEPVIRQINSEHRSVYLPRVRNVMPEVLELFDAPDAGGVSGARESTSSPLQSLYMMNSDFVASAAAGIAEQALKLPQEQRIDHVYLALVGRPPSATQRQQAIEFLNTVADSGGLNVKETLAAYCQVLLCTTEFSQID